MTLERLTGKQLSEAFLSATAWLERHVDAINAINVFPVPDGDTGTNMYLTMRSTLETLPSLDDSAPVGQVLSTMARGALMGARGNSGVILSQIIRGWARFMDGLDTLDAFQFSAALSEGARAAYQAVTRPVEGTMLTVMREAAQAVEAAVAAGSNDLARLLDTLVEAARVAVERTPTLLPALAEAGVVDSGGQGVYVLLQGLAASLKGEPLEAAAPEALLEQDWLTVTQELHKTEDSLYGYCTEFLVVGRDLDLEAIRSRMQELGDSVLVVGDDQLLRVHLHTDDPGAALSQGTRAGSLSQVKVDNIHEQAEQFLETHEKRRAPEQLLTMAPPVSDTISLIAVASGGGLQEVFRSLGVTVVVSGGPTMNPSVQELLQAAEACPTEDVIILPNDKNIIMTAEQARALTDKRLHILSTRTIPQGIAAALALHPELDVEANVVAMNEAIRGVHTIEVTRATRDVEIEEVAVRKGQMIAIVDERLALTAENPESALLAAVAMFSPKEGLLCLYCGADTPTANVLEVKRQLSERYPDCEVEIVSGGQPHYFYIASLE